MCPSLDLVHDGSRTSSIGPEQAGSVLDLCSSALGCAQAVINILQKDIRDNSAESRLKLLPLYADQAITILEQCQQEFGSDTSATLEKIRALEGSIENLDRAGKELHRQIQSAEDWQLQGRAPAGLYKYLRRLNCFARNNPLFSAADTFYEAQETLEATLQKLRSIETAGTDHYVFQIWCPDVLSPDELIYEPPVAYDTIVNSLLANSLPSKILVHGPSGNGKTKLLQQLGKAFTSQGAEAQSQLSLRFSSGMIWIDFGRSLQTNFPQFGLEIQSKAVKLARDLGVQTDKLETEDISALSALIKQQLAANSFLVVFDNVWDGSIFRRGCLDVISDRNAGVSQRSAVVIASPLNLSSLCQWHSPETLSVPLSSDSNAAACLQLLTKLVLGADNHDSLPSTLVPVARRIVKDCGGSPQAIRLLGPVLDRSLREKDWRNLHTQYLSLLEHPSLKRTSLDSTQEADTQKVLTAFQLRSRTLPPIVQQVLSTLLMFPSAHKVPVAALVVVVMQLHRLTLTEVCLAVRTLSKYSFVRILLDNGSLLTGVFSFDVTLREFLERSPHHQSPHLPGNPDPEQSLCLAIAAIYGTITYKKQALQVFSKQQPYTDARVWQETPQSGRKPYLDPFWLQLLVLTLDPGLGTAACEPLISAARSSVGLQAISEALAELFSCPQSLHAAAGVLSELAWQIEDRAFLGQVVTHLQGTQAASRLVMRMRELVNASDTRGGAEEIATLAWALADMAEYMDSTSKIKLQEEPVIPTLEYAYDGAASYAYQRLATSLSSNAEVAFLG